MLNCNPQEAQNELTQQQLDGDLAPAINPADLKGYPDSQLASLRQYSENVRKYNDGMTGSDLKIMAAQTVEIGAMLLGRTPQTKVVFDNLASAMGVQTTIEGLHSSSQHQSWIDFSDSLEAAIDDELENRDLMPSESVVA